jgi:hypothetical protein
MVCPMLNELAEGVWVAWAPQSFYGLKFGARMTVVRLGDGTLFLHSPVAIDDALKSEIDRRGDVAHIVAPNLFHHVHAGTAVARYPGAKLHIARGLAKKRPDLASGSVLSTAQDPSWRGEIEAIPIDGTMLNETVATSDDWLTRNYLKLSGIYGKPGFSRALRMAFRDKKAARRSIDSILARPFDRISLAHGDTIAQGGKEALRASYDWLRA